MGIADPAMPGEKWGRLTILADLGTTRERGRRVFCQCECGAKKELSYKLIKSGSTKSCGCYRRDYVAEKNTIHGLSEYPEYDVWMQMRQRCSNPNNDSWGRYGARGIIVCSQWEDFAVFIRDVGRRPSPEHSIERIDNSGNYEPGNCRWATEKEQQRNKRNNRRLEFRGLRLTVAEWSERTGIRHSTITRRIDLFGWSVEDALTIQYSKFSRVKQRV